MSQPILPLKYEDGQVYQSTVVDPLSQYSFLKTGWGPRTREDKLTITVNAANRTLSIAPASDPVEYWIDGVRYLLSTTQNVTWTDTEGMWYFKFTANGLTATQTIWDYTPDATYVASMYWDAANNVVIGWAPEVHDWAIHYSTHEFIHETLGCMWTSGLGVVINSGNATINVAEGELHDQTLDIDITNGVGSGWWQQELQPLNTSILYRDGASGYWRKTALSTATCMLTANIPQVNTWNGSSWVTSNTTANGYFCYWLVGSSIVDTPVYWIMGQTSSAALSDIQALKWTSLQFGQLPAEELKVLAKVIMRRALSSPYYEINSIEDLRQLSNSAGGGGGSTTGDHGGLTGLSDDDHTQYLLVDGTRAMTGCLTTNGVTSSGNLTLNSGNRVIVEKSLSIGGNHIYASDVYFDITSNDNFVVNMVTGNTPSTVSGQGCTIIGVAHEIQSNSVNTGVYSGTNHTLNDCEDSITCGGYGSVVRSGADRSGVFAGKNNTLDVNATESVVMGGEQNTLRGARSATVGGYYNIIDTGCYACAIIGGQYNTCNEVTSVIIGGDTNKAAGIGSIILGGKGNIATGKYTVTHGYYGSNTIYGAYAHTGGKIATAGDIQCFRFNVFGQTSGNTTGNLSLDGAGLNVVQPDKTVWYHRITIAVQSVNGTYGGGTRIYAATRRVGATHIFIATGNITPNPFITQDFNNVYPMAMTISANGAIYLSGNGPVSVNHNWNALWDVTQTGYF